MNTITPGTMDLGIPYLEIQHNIVECVIQQGRLCVTCC